MGKLDTQSTVTLILNGKQAETSLRDVTSAVNATRAALSRMNEADNPQLYRQRVQELQRLTEAQRQHRAQIFNTTETQTGFFASFKKGFAEIQEMAGRITAGTIIYKGVSAAINAFKDLMSGAQQAYDESERTQSQLKSALTSTEGVVGKNIEQLEEYQQKLMDQLGVDDDVIAKGEEMLLTFTNIRGKIYEDALPAIVDMTAAMNGGKVSMEGIQATSIQVGKALNDPINGMTSLRKVGVTFSDQQKEQIKTMQEANNMVGAQAIILKELQKEFGGTAKIIADTDTGVLQKYETRLGNIQESLGKWITTGKVLAATVLDPFLSWLEKATETKLSETLQHEQAELSALVGAIVSTNENQTIRNRLIDELQAKYPDFIGNISKEAANNDFLIQKLQQVNDQYRQRIFIAVNEERIKDIQETRNKAIKEEADARMRVAKATGMSMQELAKLTDAQVKALAVSQNQAEQDKAKKDRGVTGNGQWVNDQKAMVAMFDADIIVNGRKKIEASFKEEADLMGANAIMQEKVTKQRLKDIDSEVAAINRRMKTESEEAKAKDEVRLKALASEKNNLLGIVTNPTSGPSAATLAAIKSEKEKAAKELAAYKSQLRQAYDEVDQLIAKANKGSIDGLDEQLAVINDKYAKLIDKLKRLQKNPNATAEEKKRGDEDINALQTANTVENLSAINDADFKNDKGVLDDQHATELGQLKDKFTQELITEQEFNDQKLALEQKYLEDEYYLRMTYMKPVADLEARIADGEINAKKRRHDQTMKLLKEQAASEKEFHKIQQEISAQKNALALTGLSVLSEVFGKSKGIMLAQLALEKAIAIGKIIASEGVEIAGYWASQALHGPLGWSAAATMTAAAQTRAGLSIAIIAAEGIGQAAGILSSGGEKKKAAKGALIPDGPSHGEGGIDLVNNQTGATIAEMEGGEPIMILSKDTYRNNRMLVNELLYNSQYRNGAPVTVNTAYATRPASSIYQNGGMINNISPPGNNTINQVANNHDDSDMKMVKESIAAISELLQRETSRPVVLSNRVRQLEDDRNIEIRNAANA